MVDAGDLKSPAERRPGSNPGSPTADALRQRRNRNRFRDMYILVDSRKSDKRKGFENDLTREFIRNTIKNGCSYCGETELRITLDRIDNNIGHLQSNVIPACIRCNYTRKDMPYEAWLLVAAGMKAARLAGFFGEWTGKLK